jgi:hypothetical protein
MLFQKQIILLDNSGSMSGYDSFMRSNLKKLSSVLINSVRLFVFNSQNAEVKGKDLVDKVDKYETPNGGTQMKGVMESLLDILLECEHRDAVHILFITDGEVTDLDRAQKEAVLCLKTIVNKQLSVFVSCVAVKSSADMRAFSLLGISNNFSIFQLIRSNGYDEWYIDVIKELSGIAEKDVCVYSQSLQDCNFVHKKVIVDALVSENGKHNSVYLASMVQAFIICNFAEVQEDGFLYCKNLLKYIADMGINANTRYIWSKLNTAKMVSNKNSKEIADEFTATILDSVERADLCPTAVPSSTLKDEVITFINEHDVRVRLYTGTDQSFSNCLPMKSRDNQVFVSTNKPSIFLNIEVYHPTSPVDLEVSFGGNVHQWYIPFGVALIEGDNKYLMLSHEKCRSHKERQLSDELLFNFIIKAKPSKVSMAKPESSESSSESYDHSVLSRKKTSSKKRLYCTDIDSSNSRSCRAFSLKSASHSSQRAFGTVSSGSRKIDTIKRKMNFSPNTHVLCLSFIFVANDDMSAQPFCYTSETCVICLDALPSVTLLCNHQCICSECFSHAISSCPICRASLV